MINHNGQLFNNNQCCNGQKFSNGEKCHNGNRTCLPYWRICIIEIEPNYHQLNRELNELTSTTTTKKPWIFTNFFYQKLFKSTKNQQNKKNVNIKNIINNMTINNCPIGYWSSSIISFQTKFPIQMYKLINITTNGNELISSRNFVTIVEILNRNNKNNELISRQINYYNLLYNQQQRQLTDEWFYGGYIDNNQNNQTSNNFQYRYRWHLKLLNDNDNELINFNENKCPTGYTGDDCNKPICLDGCHQEHGYCDQPGQCSCRFGWTGIHCQNCLLLPGCIHGTCTRPLECRCKQGWTGMFCSIPICKSGCHSQNGYCTKPNECKCKFGWQGENCTECSTLPGCQHGTCNEPLDCNCLDGYEGTFCSTPKCSEGCMYGWCQNPDECICKIGYRGVNCSECVPYPNCKFGECRNMNEPWTCKCFNGYGGFLCDERLDYCERQLETTTTATNLTEQQTICLNGGTCISLTHTDGDYRCQCQLGYTGKNCETFLNNTMMINQK